MPHTVIVSISLWKAIWKILVTVFYLSPRILPFICNITA